MKSLGCDSSIDVICFDLKLIHMSCDLISTVITNIINTSLSCGKMTPVYNGKGPRDDKNNYRPIS